MASPPLVGFVAEVKGRHAVRASGPLHFGWRRSAYERAPSNADPSREKRRETPEGRQRVFDRSHGRWGKEGVAHDGALPAPARFCGIDHRFALHVARKAARALVAEKKKRNGAS